MHQAKSTNRQSGFSTILVVAIGVVIIAMAAFAGFRIFFGMKTITYDNGIGSTFKLSYYNLFETSKVASKLLSGASGVSPNLVGLFSQVSKSHKAPLALYISGSPASKTDLENYKNNCPSQLPEVFTAHNNYSNSDLPVCSIKTTDGKDLMYLARFHDTKDIYLAVFFQGIDLKQATASQQAAKAAVNQTGLSSYRSDVIKIVDSIRPVN